MMTGRIPLLPTLFVLLCTGPLYAQNVETQWGGPAEITYDTGFADRVMKHPQGGISLFNMQLIENDAPGSGFSEKGVTLDTVWGKNYARKILTVDDPRADKAWLVVYIYDESTKTDLHFDVNGYKGVIHKTNRECYRWVEFPVSYLKKGKNGIELSCPDAASEKEGWTLLLARADEFEAGGGDPTGVGECSYKSIDGGKTWKQSPFGPEGKDRAEYTVRLSLDRYVPCGYMETPVIDLWRGDSTDFIATQRKIEKLNIRMESDIPEGTGIVYSLRKGLDPSPYGKNWEPYQKIGENAPLDFTIDGDSLNRRYVQFRIELSTGNPLNSPIVKSVQIRATVQERVTMPPNIHVVEVDNPQILYPTVQWEWEKWDRPEFVELRQRENLDEVIGDARTEFAGQVRLLDHATKRFDNYSPIPEYPGWDALSILDRINKAGNGGMCIQLNNLLAGMCMAYGWQARLVNIISHEVCEVWNDDLAKWIYIDASSVNHYIYDKTTAEPLSLLELHQRFLKKYSPGRPIDWMNDPLTVASMDDEFDVAQGSLTHHTYPWNGVTLAAHIRMVPRNNWYEKPYPRPLSHGKTWWPWDGYINWYDEQTPPKKQYSWHTDRPQDMWPELNRVHVDATVGYGNDRLFLRFETYTPNFSHFEVNPDDTEWRETGEYWVWILQPGRNTLRVRAVSQFGVKGKPASIVLNHGNAVMEK
ncbi:MAG TPA: hypothetical protein PLQ35_16305 [bacterium]|nr:hypothetical protein [bacterium]HQL63841.1 hypothetical protein [bacterium]